MGEYSTRELLYYKNDFSILPNEYDSLEDDWVPKACKLAYTTFRNHERVLSDKRFASRNRHAMHEFYKSLLFSFATQYELNASIHHNYQNEQENQDEPVRKKYYINVIEVEERRKLMNFLEERGLSFKKDEVPTKEMLIFNLLYPKYLYPISVDVAEMKYGGLIIEVNSSEASTLDMMDVEEFYKIFCLPKTTFEQYCLNVKEYLVALGYTKEQMNRYISKRMNYLFLNYGDYISGRSDARPSIVARALDVVIRPQRLLEESGTRFKK